MIIMLIMSLHTSSAESALIHLQHRDCLLEVYNVTLSSYNIDLMAQLQG
jgi:hypothetical protein